MCGTSASRGTKTDDGDCNLFWWDVGGANSKKKWAGQDDNGNFDKFEGLLPATLDPAAAFQYRSSVLKNCNTRQIVRKVSGSKAATIIGGRLPRDGQASRYVGVCPFATLRSVATVCRPVCALPTASCPRVRDHLVGLKPYTVTLPAARSPRGRRTSLSHTHSRV